MAALRDRYARSLTDPEATLVETPRPSLPASAAPPPALAAKGWGCLPLLIGAITLAAALATHAAAR